MARKKIKKKDSSNPSSDRGADDAQDDFVIQGPRRPGSVNTASQRRQRRDSDADADSTKRSNSSDDVSTNSAETARSSISAASDSPAEPVRTTTGTDPNKGMESLSHSHGVTLSENQTQEGEGSETRTQQPLGDEARETRVTNPRTMKPSDPNVVVNTNLTDAHEQGMAEGDWDIDHQSSSIQPLVTTPEMHPSDLVSVGDMPPGGHPTILANTTPL